MSASFTPEQNFDLAKIKQQHTQRMDYFDKAFALIRTISLIVTILGGTPAMVIAIYDAIARGVLL